MRGGYLNTSEGPRRAVRRRQVASLKGGRRETRLFRDREILRLLPRGAIVNAVNRLGVWYDRPLTRGGMTTGLIPWRDVPARLRPSARARKR